MRQPRRPDVQGDEGFTLIELMVVVLIISILIGIAIPTFLGARERAQDAAAQSRLDIALKAADVYWAEHESWKTLSARLWLLDENGARALEAIEPSIDFAINPRYGTEQVGASVFATTDTGEGNTRGQMITLWTESESGTWFCLVYAKLPTTRYGTDMTNVHYAHDDRERDVDSPRECLMRANEGW